jgi:hypothetical protein
LLSSGLILGFSHTIGISDESKYAMEAKSSSSADSFVWKHKQSSRTELHKYLLVEKIAGLHELPSTERRSSWEEIDAIKQYRKP